MTKRLYDIVIHTDSYDTRFSFVSGRWTEEEENVLSQCVREQTNTKEGEPVTSGVIWSKIAEKLGTRTEKQCRSKWYGNCG